MTFLNTLKKSVLIGTVGVLFLKNKVLGQQTPYPKDINKRVVTAPAGFRHEHAYDGIQPTPDNVTLIFGKMGDERFPRPSKKLNRDSLSLNYVPDSDSIPPPPVQPDSIVTGGKFKSLHLSSIGYVFPHAKGINISRQWGSLDPASKTDTRSFHSCATLGFGYESTNHANEYHILVENGIASDTSIHGIERDRPVGRTFYGGGDYSLAYNFSNKGKIILTAGAYVAQKRFHLEKTDELTPTANNPEPEPRQTHYNFKTYAVCSSLTLLAEFEAYKNLYLNACIEIGQATSIGLFKGNFDNYNAGRVGFGFGINYVLTNKNASNDLNH